MEEKEGLRDLVLVPRDGRRNGFRPVADPVFRRTVDRPRGCPQISRPRPLGRRRKMRWKAGRHDGRSLVFRFPSPRARGRVRAPVQSPPPYFGDDDPLVAARAADPSHALHGPSPTVIA
jgi:hypothetical protein